MDHLIQIVKSLSQNHAFLCYLVVFLVSYLESFAFVGLIMPGAGFAFSIGIMAYHGFFNLSYLIIAGAIGAILADISSFYLAIFLKDKSVLLWLKKRYILYFEKGEIFFKKYGSISIFLGRFIGFTRPVIPFIAGLLKMDAKIFLTYCTLSGILWGIAYYGAGYLMGMGISLIPGKEIKIILIIIALITIIVIKKLKK